MRTKRYPASFRALGKETEETMTNFILSHWFSFLYLFAMLLLVGGVQWQRSRPAPTPKREQDLVSGTPREA
jgi:hypothetical protein